MTATTMPPLNLRWRVLGRPVKPVAFGLMLSMGVISVTSTAGVGVLAGSAWRFTIGATAAVAALVLFVGWARKSQTIAVTGLLLAFSVWFARGCLILLVAPDPWLLDGLWMSFGWAIVAAGSYHLEVADTLPQE